MALTLTQNPEAVVSRKYKVYIKENDATIDTAIDNLIATNNKTNYDALKALLIQIGATKPDATKSSLTKGDVEDTAEFGEVPLDLNGELEFELINVVKNNIDGLEALDKKTLTVLLETNDDKASETSSDGHYLLYRKLVYNYEESYTSGGVLVLPFKFKKVVDSPRDFRIYEMIPTS